MATIYSSDLKLSIMATGENAGTWGQITNTNLYLLQQAIGGYQDVSIAGGAQTTTLAMSDGALSNARNAVIKLTGTITGNQVVTIPTGIEKTYIISNGTTGAFTVEFKQAGGTGITFGTTDKSTRILFADGTNIVDTGTVSETGVQTLTNKTLTSPIINEIDDANGNEQVIFSSTASAINELTITNAAAGNAPSIATTGGDTNIGLTIAPKGTGDVNVDADTLRVGDSNADATITTNGTGDLTLSTNAGSSSGTIKIFDGANGNIEITPNGSGVVKLDGLSYPTADGSANQALVTNGSGVLSFAAVGASAGQVIQVVSTTKTDVFTASLNNSFTDITGLSVTITPSSASNKILITSMVNFGSSTGYPPTLRLFRDSTHICKATGSIGSRQNSTTSAGGGQDTSDQNRGMTNTISFLDSPATTSAITYKINGGVLQAAGVFSCNTSGSDIDQDYMVRCASTITVMEIKG
jgi:hypothetical protein